MINTEKLRLNTINMQLPFQAAKAAISVNKIKKDATRLVVNLTIGSLHNIQCMANKNF